MKEKIKHWTEEKEKLETRQKEMNQKYNEQIKNLQLKIRDGEKALVQKENKMIADEVRNLFKDSECTSVEDFLQKIKQSFEQQ